MSGSEINNSDNDMRYNLDSGGVNHSSLSANPLVSVLICNYNYGCYLGEAIESALAQTWGKVEIIVVDDGSTDESRNILKKYEGKIKIILKENAGQASAFNAGIAEALGEIVCFLDSDDTCHANRISRVIDKYKQGHWGLVCHDLELIDGNGTSLQTKWSHHAGVTMSEGKPIEVIIENNYRWIFSPTSGMSLTKSLADRIFPIPCEKWKISADDPLAFSAAFLDAVGIITETLGSYRLHGKNLYAAAYSDMEARNIAGITHATRRYFFCKILALRYRYNLPQFKNNYFYYRRCCLIAREKPYKYILSLLKINVKYNLQINHNIFVSIFNISIYSAADLFIIMKRLLIKSSKHNLLKKRFDKESLNIEEDQLKYILYDE